MRQRKGIGLLESVADHDSGITAKAYRTLFSDGQYPHSKENLKKYVADLLTVYPASSNQLVLPSDLKQRKGIELPQSAADHDSDTTDG